MYRLIFLLLFIINYPLSIIHCSAQDKDIRSVQFFVGDNEQSDQVMELNGTEQLTLWFDDLNEERAPLNYTIVHCDADWREDGLFFADYLDGFEENPLRDYALSFQTKINYMHYELRIPNKDVRFKASGNYLLKIYEDDRSAPVLVCRFSLYENRVVEVPLRMRTPVQTGEKCLQQLEFSVKHASLPVRDAYRELKLRVTQNGISVPGIDPPKPVFVDRDEVSYTFTDRNFYPGGNEFRIFDTRTLDFGAQGVTTVRYDGQGFPYALLNVDRPGTGRPYLFHDDINGKFHVEAYRMGNRQLEAEYVATGFTLKTDELHEGQVYVFGELSNWALQPAFRMFYNHETQAYELNVPLKQGYYNYRYVYVGNNGTVDFTAIEGCFSETENYYTVFVYYRGTRDKYDRLVAVQSISSL